MSNSNRDKPVKEERISLLQWNWCG